MELSLFRRTCDSWHMCTHTHTLSGGSPGRPVFPVHGWTTPPSLHCTKWGQITRGSTAGEEEPPENIVHRGPVVKKKRSCWRKGSRRLEEDGESDAMISLDYYYFFFKDINRDAKRFLCARSWTQQKSRPEHKHRHIREDTCKPSVWIRH